MKFIQKMYGLGKGSNDLYLKRWKFVWPGRSMKMRKVDGTLGSFQLGFYLHKFYRGDYDRSFHDHPWGFWTFPLKTYYELVLDERFVVKFNTVKRFRWHYRPASYAHIVLNHMNTFPLWTIVLPEVKVQKWGFFKYVNNVFNYEWIHHSKYTGDEYGH